MALPRGARTTRFERRVPELITLLLVTD